MSIIDDLLTQIPMDQLARQLGVSPGEAETLTRQALPALVGGMEANAQDPRGATSLAQALRQHDNDLLDGGVDLDQVDTDDGYKIVLNVFGGNSDKVINRLGSGSGSGNKDSMMSKLLPMLAPIVMAYLAKRMTGGSKNATKGKTGKAGAGKGDDLSGGLGELLGGLLGGGSGGSGGLGDLLGGLGVLLGGGKR